MQAFSVVVCCLLLGAVSAAPATTRETPTPCCLNSTYQYNGTITFTQEVYGKPAAGMSESTSYYDPPNKRFSVDQDVMINGVTTRTLVIQESGAGPVYVAVPSMRYCAPTPIPLFEGCVNEKPGFNIKFVAKQVLGGAGGPSLDVNVWETTGETEGLRLYAKTFKTEGKCIDVFASYMVDTKDFKQISTIASADVKIGPIDPKVFALPDYCKKNKAERKIPEDIANNVVKPHHARRLLGI